MAWAASPVPGSVIENQATGTFVNPSNSDRVNIESNLVQVTVAEVTGVTLTPSGVQEASATISNPGPSQGNNSINAEDVVYFLFKATNVGNDPTQFFIPGSPSSIIGGIQAGQMEIIEVDADGPDGPTAPTNFSSLPITIRPEGNNTGDATVLGLPVGGLPAEGTITLRIPVKLDAGLNAGDAATVVLGDTGTNDNAPGTQNQPYLVSSEPNPPTGGFDFYTQDNQDTDGIVGEANGVPINGDTTLHRQEASATQIATMTALGLTLDYGDAPDTGVGTAPGNYQTTAADSGPSHVIDPNLYLGTAPDGDDGTQQNVAANQDDNFIAADEGTLTLSTIEETATTYSVEDIAVTNNTRFNATLMGWIDFNQNGLFEVTESTTVSVPNTGSQTVDLAWVSLPGLSPGLTYARFRLTTDAAILPAGEPLPTGAANDGEVEDYVISVSSNFSVSGLLYEDNDGEDDYDVGETLLPDEITVRLMSSDGSTEIASTITNSSGAYSFLNVEPGTYQIQVETSDPEIPYFYTLGTPNNLLITVNNNSTDLNFGFDRRTLENGGFLPACENPYGEVYSVSSFNGSSFGNPGTISAVHGDTGSVYELTTSSFGVTAINGAATDHVNRLVYYGDSNSLYAWDAINDQHFLITNDFNAELTTAGYTGIFSTLSSGGAAFYNGSLYFGVDGSTPLYPQGINHDFEIFKVDFTDDGRTITGVTPLDIVNQSLNALDRDSEDWGDFIIDDNGVLLGTSSNRDGAGQHIWQFDLTTNTYTNLGAAPFNFQLAKDGSGRLWALPDDAIQEIDVNGNLIGSANSAPGHRSYDAAECVQGLSTIGDRVWNDNNNNGIQESGELGIPNVTVGLYRDIGNNGVDAGDPLLDTQVTNANGNYDFTDLIFGDYYVRVLEGTSDDQDTTNVLADATLTTTTTTPGGLHDVIVPTGINDYNDADFGYSLAIDNPEVILIKRITAINGVPINPNDSTDLSVYVDGTGPADNHANWPEGADAGTDPDLYGAITGGVVQPNDEIEYTIYFLSAGNETAENVVFCDRIPDGQTFILDSFNSGTPAPDGLADEDRGIEISTNNATLAYTNIGGDDTGRFYPATSGLPPTCNTLIPNTENNGAVVIDLGTLPNSTGAGIPANSTGYVRFRTKTQ